MREACADNYARGDGGRAHGRRRARTREHAREPVFKPKACKDVVLVNNKGFRDVILPGVDCLRG